MGKKKKDKELLEVVEKSIPVEKTIWQQQQEERTRLRKETAQKAVDEMKQYFVVKCPNETKGELKNPSYSKEVMNDLKEALREKGWENQIILKKVGWIYKRIEFELRNPNKPDQADIGG